ncbi:MAG: AsmA family protein [Alphaproteobacteria bacterium]|nr:AsmA family protein [Alphaproteobacteria bacterium]
MKRKKNRFFSFVRFFGLCVGGLLVASVVTLTQIDFEKLRGNVVAVLRDSTGLPIEVEGPVSWKLSLRPEIELNQVRVANKTWAKSKYGFEAEKIDVRLNLISLFRDRPTIQNVIVHNAKVNLEKNLDGKLSISPVEKSQTSTEQSAVQTPEVYPFRDAGLGGLEIKKLNANIFGQKYSVAGFNIRLMHKHDVREYTGWIKLDKDVRPFIVSLSPYNSERRVYPLRIAISTGGDALIANIALEGTSKMPIDFIVKGDIPQPDLVSKFFNLGVSGIPRVKLNIAGGIDHGRVTLRKSSVMFGKTEFTVSGSYDWGKNVPVMTWDLQSGYVALADLFPGVYGKKWVRPNRDLNVFKDVPLYGDWFRGKNITVRVDFDNFVVVRDFNIKNLDLKLDLKNDAARMDLNANVASGDVRLAANIDIDETGRLWTDVAAQMERIYVGEILSQVYANDFLSELPVNVELYVRANGENLTEIMQTITGPVRVYSVGAGYAHSALVSYMYGADFLTNLRHSVQDLFSSEKKYNQMKVSCVAVNAVLRDGVLETQNGVAVETNAINVRLAGALDLGDEEIKMSLTTVPVRGLKLSLTGNVVNSMELTGSLAEPGVKISGAAVAGKVASATGLGLLLAPFTGGIGLVADTGLGLVAGDLLENWLADDKPCETALERGAVLYPDDPDWLGVPMAELIGSVLDNQR